MNFTDRIRPTDKGITTYLDELENLDYQIPTFQRDVVWEKENVKKLWDSIYKFYPLGSILAWKTGIKLQNHRKIEKETQETGSGLAFCLSRIKWARVESFSIYLMKTPNQARHPTATVATSPFAPGERCGWAHEPRNP